jgi:prevent-host-death family protein
MSAGKTVGLREAKANLSRLVERVRRGQVVTITVRGRKVARLVPVSDDSMSVQDRIDDLVASGIVSAPSGKQARPVRMKPIEIEPHGIAQRLLRKDRDAR